MAQPTTDLDILNYALTLEYFEGALYKTLIAANLLAGVEAQFLQTFADHEASHAANLAQTIMALGGTPVAPLPTYNLPRITSRSDLLSTIVSVEDLGASAYLGQVPYLQNKDLLEAAIRIHNVEAEHAAAWRVVAGSPVAPDTVAKGMAYDDVLRIVMPFMQAPVTPAPATPTPMATSVPTATTPPATAVPATVVPAATVVPPTTAAPPATVAPSVAIAPPIIVPTLPPVQSAPTSATGFPELPFTPRRLGNG